MSPLDADALERRLPWLAEAVSRSPGVGFVLARSADGPVCFRDGRRHHLDESELGPFAGRPDAKVVVQGIVDLMSMPSAGDLVIYGIDAPQGHVSFIPEVGAHAGPSPEELHTFIVCPPTVRLSMPNHASGPALRSLHPLSGRRLTTLGGRRPRFRENSSLARDHRARKPPSMARTWPVTMADARDARKRTAPTISSGSAKRPIGVSCSMRWTSSGFSVMPRVKGVRTQVGAMAFTR
jgi:hypothetical protein